MHNPQSAIERIKNSLSYKLGSAILEHKKQYGRGFLILIYKLYKIKKQHFRDQKLYKQVTKIFPQLAYPKLETCSDYNESIRYKYHLSYMLGEVLIHAHKTWHKGGYFKLYKNIQIIKRQYNLLKELSLNNIDISLENKELLINNFEAIKDILQTHKDYKPILENIFHNFKFFLVNLTLIKEWLLSDDFYQRYKKENHPYPSLLDPKKLNNDSEEINYKNIPAELAWEMNLPLPDKYKFVFVRLSLSGGAAMFSFLNKCGVDTCVSSVKLNFIKNLTYENIFSKFKDIENDCCISIFDDIACKTMERSKLLFFVEKNKKILMLVRDPIERLKHAINHGDYKNNKQRFDENIDTRKPIEDEIDRSVYFFDDKNCNFYNFVKGCITWPTYNYKKIIDPILDKNEILYLDMKEILPDKVFGTMSNLSQILNFSAPKLENKDFFEGIKNGNFRFHIPVTLCFYK
ncbi:DUF2972 domain-containing protein, partial [Campylobacter coli]|nr:DUF2972 domain-containing protein [Campylobacter coli]